MQIHTCYSGLLDLGSGGLLDLGSGGLLDSGSDDLLSIFAGKTTFLAGSGGLLDIILPMAFLTGCDIKCLLLDPPSHEVHRNYGKIYTAKASSARAFLVST